MVIADGKGHDGSSSNPGGGCLLFIALILLGKVRIQLFSLQLWVNSGADSLVSSRNFRQWSRRPEFSPRSRHTNDFKNATWYLLAYHLIPPCLPCNIRYVSRVKWSKSGKGVVPSLTPWCSSYWKVRLRIAQTTISITVTIMTHFFFSSQKRSRN